MECSEVRMGLDEYLDGRTETGRRKNIELHLAGCRRCLEELTALKEINELLKVEKEASPSQEFTAGIMGAIERDRERSRVSLFKRFPVINLGASLVLTGLLVILINTPGISRVIDRYGVSLLDGASSVNANISTTTDQIHSYLVNIIKSGGKIDEMHTP